MPDYSAKACVTLVFGRSGSGKTSLVFRYLLNRAIEQPANTTPAACIFIFDWKLEASNRLGLPWCGTAAQCETAVSSRWVIFNPHVMFKPEKGKDPAEERALRWFLDWAFTVSQRGPGKKIIYVDELHYFVPNNSNQLPPELERITRQGRIEGIELVCSTQYPKDYARTIRGSVTEWICFSTSEPAELDAVRPYFPGVDRVATFPPGQFVAVNRDNGAQLNGRLF